MESRHLPNPASPDLESPVNVSKLSDSPESPSASPPKQVRVSDKPITSPSKKKTNWLGLHPVDVLKTTQAYRANPDVELPEIRGTQVIASRDPRLSPGRPPTSIYARTCAMSDEGSERDDESDGSKSCSEDWIDEDAADIFETEAPKLTVKVHINPKFLPTFLGSPPPGQESCDANRMQTDDDPVKEKIATERKVPVSSNDKPREDKVSSWIEASQTFFKKDSPSDNPVSVSKPRDTEKLSSKGNIGKDNRKELPKTKPDFVAGAVANVPPERQVVYDTVISQVLKPRGTSKIIEKTDLSKSSRKYKEDGEKKQEKLRREVVYQKVKEDLEIKSSIVSKELERILKSKKQKVEKKSLYSPLSEKEADLEKSPPRRDVIRTESKRDHSSKGASFKRSDSPEVVKARMRSKESRPRKIKDIPSSPQASPIKRSNVKSEQASGESKLLSGVSAKLQSEERDSPMSPDHQEMKDSEHGIIIDRYNDYGSSAVVELPSSKKSATKRKSRKEKNRRHEVSPKPRPHSKRDKPASQLPSSENKMGFPISKDERLDEKIKHYPKAENVDFYDDQEYSQRSFTARRNDAREGYINPRSSDKSESKINSKSSKIDQQSELQYAFVIDEAPYTQKDNISILPTRARTERTKTTSVKGKLPQPSIYLMKNLQENCENTRGRMDDFIESQKESFLTDMDSMFNDKSVLERDRKVKGIIHLPSLSLSTQLESSFIQSAMVKNAHLTCLKDWMKQKPLDMLLLGRTDKAVLNGQNNLHGTFSSIKTDDTVQRCLEKFHAGVYKLFNGNGNNKDPETVFPNPNNKSEETVSLIFSQVRKEMNLICEKTCNNLQKRHGRSKKRCIDPEREVSRKEIQKKRKKESKNSGKISQASSEDYFQHATAPIDSHEQDLERLETKRGKFRGSGLNRFQTSEVFQVRDTDDTRRDEVNEIKEEKRGFDATIQLREEKARLSSLISPRTNEVKMVPAVKDSPFKDLSKEPVSYHHLTYASRCNFTDSSVIDQNNSVERPTSTRVSSLRSEDHMSKTSDLAAMYSPTQPTEMDDVPNQTILGDTANAYTYSDMGNYMEDQSQFYERRTKENKKEKKKKDKKKDKKRDKEEKDRKRERKKAKHSVRNMLDISGKEIEKENEVFGEVRKEKKHKDRQKSSRYYDPENEDRRKWTKSSRRGEDYDENRSHSKDKRKDKSEKEGHPISMQNLVISAEQRRNFLKLSSKPCYRDSYTSVIRDVYGQKPQPNFSYDFDPTRPPKDHFQNPYAQTWSFLLNFTKENVDLLSFIEQYCPDVAKFHPRNLNSANSFLWALTLALHESILVAKNTELSAMDAMHDTKDEICSAKSSKHVSDIEKIVLKFEEDAEKQSVTSRRMLAAMRQELKRKALNQAIDKGPKVKVSKLSPELAAKKPAPKSAKPLFKPPIATVMPSQITAGIRAGGKAALLNFEQFSDSVSQIKKQAADGNCINVSESDVTEKTCRNMLNLFVNKTKRLIATRYTSEELTVLSDMPVPELATHTSEMRHLQPLSSVSRLLYEENIPGLPVTEELPVVTDIDITDIPTACEIKLIPDQTVRGETLHESSKSKAQLAPKETISHSFEKEKPLESVQISTEADLSLSMQRKMELTFKEFEKDIKSITDRSRIKEDPSKEGDGFHTDQMKKVTKQEIDGKKYRKAKRSKGTICAPFGDVSTDSSEDETGQPHETVEPISSNTNDLHSKKNVHFMPLKTTHIGSPVGKMNESKSFNIESVTTSGIENTFPKLGESQKSTPAPDVFKESTIRQLQSKIDTSSNSQSEPIEPSTKTEEVSSSGVETLTTNARFQITQGSWNEVKPVDLVQSRSEELLPESSREPALQSATFKGISAKVKEAVLQDIKEIYQQQREGSESSRSNTMPSGLDALQQLQESYGPQVKPDYQTESPPNVDSPSQNKTDTDIVAHRVPSPEQSHTEEIAESGLEAIAPVANKPVAPSNKLMQAFRQAAGTLKAGRVKPAVTRIIGVKGKKVNARELLDIVRAKKSEIEDTAPKLPEPFEASFHHDITNLDMQLPVAVEPVKAPDPVISASTTQQDTSNQDSDMEVEQDNGATNVFSSNDQTTSSTPAVSTLDLQPQLVAKTPVVEVPETLPVVEPVQESTRQDLNLDLSGIPLPDLTTAPPPIPQVLDEPPPLPTEEQPSATNEAWKPSDVSVTTPASLYSNQEEYAALQASAANYSGSFEAYQQYVQQYQQWYSQVVQQYQQAGSQMQSSYPYSYPPPMDPTVPPPGTSGPSYPPPVDPNQSTSQSGGWYHGYSSYQQQPSSNQTVDPSQTEGDGKSWEEGTSDNWWESYGDGQHHNWEYPADSGEWTEEGDWENENDNDTNWEEASEEYQDENDFKNFESHSDMSRDCRPQGGRGTRLPISGRGRTLLETPKPSLLATPYPLRGPRPPRSEGAQCFSLDDAKSEGGGPRFAPPGAFRGRFPPPGAFRGRFPPPSESLRGRFPTPASFRGRAPPPDALRGRFPRPGGPRTGPPGTRPPLRMPPSRGPPPGLLPSPDEPDVEFQEEDLDPEDDFPDHDEQSSEFRDRGLAPDGFLGPRTEGFQPRGPRPDRFRGRGPLTERFRGPPPDGFRPRGPLPPRGPPPVGFGDRGPSPDRPDEFLERPPPGHSPRALKLGADGKPVLSRKVLLGSSGIRPLHNAPGSSIRMFVFNKSKNLCQSIERFLLFMGARTFNPFQIHLLEENFPIEIMVLVHDEDLAEVHRIPNLLELKQDPRVRFVTYQDVQDVKHRRYKTIFDSGGLIIPEEDTLLRSHPDTLEALCQFLVEETTGGTPWTMMASRSLLDSIEKRIDSAMEDQVECDRIRKLRLLLERYEEREVVKLLDKDDDDWSTRSISDYIKTCVRLQCKHASTYRHCFFLTDFPSTDVAAEMFMQKGISVLSFEDFMRHLAEEDVPPSVISRGQDCGIQRSDSFEDNALTASTEQVEL